MHTIIYYSDGTSKWMTLMLSYDFYIFYGFSKEDESVLISLLINSNLLSRNPSCAANQLKLTGCGDKDVAFVHMRYIKHLKGRNVLHLSVCADFPPRRRVSVTNSNSHTG